MFRTESGDTLELGTPEYHKEAQKIIRQYGTRNEVERLDAGVLPDHEYEQIVSDVLFDAVLDMPVRRKIKDNAVRQIAVRRGQADWEDDVTYEIVEAADSLSAEQWENFKKVKSRMPKAQVKAFWVIAKCGDYEQRHAAASVEIKLGERTRRIDVYLDPDYQPKQKGDTEGGLA